MKRLSAAIIMLFLIAEILCIPQCVLAEDSSEILKREQVLELLNTINSPSNYYFLNDYDYGSNDTSDVIKFIADRIVNGDYKEEFKEIDISTPDPMNKLYFDFNTKTYYEIDGSIIDLYLETLFNKVPDHKFERHTFYYDCTAYYNELNGKYYFINSPKYSHNKCGYLGFSEYANCSKLSDGRYYIKLIDNDNGYVNKHIIAKPVIFKDKECWSIYNVSDYYLSEVGNNINTDFQPVDFHFQHIRYDFYLNGQKINLPDESSNPVTLNDNIYIPLKELCDVINVGVTKSYGVENRGYNISANDNVYTLEFDTNKLAKSYDDYTEYNCGIFTDEDKEVNADSFANTSYIPVEMLSRVLSGLDDSYEINSEEKYVNMIAPDFKIDSRITEIKNRYKAVDMSNDYSIEETKGFDNETLSQSSTTTKYYDKKTNKLVKEEYVWHTPYLEASEYQETKYYDENGYVYFKKAFFTEAYGHYDSQTTEKNYYYEKGTLIRCEG